MCTALSQSLPEPEQQPLGLFLRLCKHWYFLCMSEHLFGLWVDPAARVKQELSETSPLCKHHRCMCEGLPGHQQVPNIAGQGSDAGGSGLTCWRAAALKEDTRDRV